MCVVVNGIFVFAKKKSRMILENGHAYTKYKIMVSVSKKKLEEERFFFEIFSREKRDRLSCYRMTTNYT